MVNASVLSVNIGRPETGEWTGRMGRSGIRKTARPGPVPVRHAGLLGDAVCDTRDHVGPDHAVYAYAREDLDHWGRLLGAELPDGQFGENLTVRGLDVNDALIGERWRVGTALLEVCKVRTPCRVFAGFMEVTGHDPSGWIRWFTQVGRPGPYLRVLEEGVVSAGDPVVVEHRPDHDVTVRTVFRAVMGEYDLLPRVLAVPELSESLREKYGPRAPRGENV